MAVVRILLVALGALGLLDTAAVSMVSNMNLGVLLPGIMGLPLLGAGILLPWLWGGPLRWLLFFAAVCYAIAALAFTATWAVIALGANAPAPEDADVLIVLGAGLRGNTPMLTLRNRMDAATAYLDASPRTVAILSGGKGEGETISEAAAMFTYLRAHGIPESRLIQEDRSESTEENFRFSGRIIQERFGENAKIAFVTTDFHVYRAGRVANRQGIRATGIPAPDVWYLALNNRLRECVALWKYALMGWI